MQKKNNKHGKKLLTKPSLKLEETTPAKQEEKQNEITESSEELTTNEKPGCIPPIELSTNGKPGCIPPAEPSTNGKPGCIPPIEPPINGKPGCIPPVMNMDIVDLNVH